MLRFFISVSDSRASTSAPGTCRFSSWQNSPCVTLKRVSLCHSVSSPSNPTTRTAIVPSDYRVPPGLPPVGWPSGHVTGVLPASTRRVLRHRHIEPEEFVMVGNSLRSDVVPVVEVGARAVHIPYVMTWHLEHVDDAAMPSGGWYRLGGIAEL